VFSDEGWRMCTIIEHVSRYVGVVRILLKFLTEMQILLTKRFDFNTHINEHVIHT